jgi:hypothetical protein
MASGEVTLEISTTMISNGMIGSPAIIGSLLITQMLLNRMGLMLFSTSEQS